MVKRKVKADSYQISELENYSTAKSNVFSFFHVDFGSTVHKSSIRECKEGKFIKEHQHWELPVSE